MGLSLQLLNKMDDFKEKGMEKNCGCATFYDFEIGGVPTYYLRMFRWANKQGYKNFLFIKRGNFIDKNLKNMLHEAQVKIVEIDFNLRGVAIYEDNKRTNDIFLNNLLLICSDLHCFVHFTHDKRFNMFNLIFYSLHPRATQISRSKFINFRYKRYLVSLTEQNMIFMDKETEEGYTKYYKSGYNRNQYYRVGDFIPDLDDKMVKKRACDKEQIFKVLTVARMDFPFKGYVYGLVHDIGRLNIKEKIELVVVGDGPQFEVIKELAYEKQKQLNNVQIDLIGRVPYEELDKYYKDATVFVGGGTTLIEASKYGTPSIVTTDNQMGTCCVGYMDEEYDNFGGVLSGEPKDVINLLKKVSEMSMDEYIDFENRCYSVVKDEYDINLIMNRIFSIQAKKINPSFGLVCLDLFLIKLKKLKRR